MRLARPRIRGMSSTRSWSSPRVSHMRGSGARVGDPLACSHAGEAPEVGEEMVRSIRKRHETFREPTGYCWRIHLGASTPLSWDDLRRLDVSPRGAPCRCSP